MLKAKAKRGHGVSNGGHIEDPGPQATAKNTEIAGHPPPPNMGRFETWSSPNSSNTRNQGNVAQVQDPIDAFDFGSDMRTPVDPLGRAVGAATTKISPRRVKKPPPPPPPKLKLPPPPPIVQSHLNPRLPNAHSIIPLDQATQQQQSHGFNNSHLMPKQPPPPPLVGQRAQPRMAPPSTSAFRPLDHQPQQAAPTKKPPPPPPIVHSNLHPRPPNAHSFMLHARPDAAAAKSKGQDLMDNMNSTIRGLSETLARQRRDLQEKDLQLSNVDTQLGRMNAFSVCECYLS
jgi:hypothetical protein